MKTPRSKRRYILPAILALLPGAVFASTHTAEAETVYTTQYTPGQPSKTTVYSGSTVAAVYTWGARTVIFPNGPSRRLTDAADSHQVSVEHTTWVRNLPEPFTGTIDWAWFNTYVNQSYQDLLSMAMQYKAGANSIYEQDGLYRVAGDASYGTDVGADFTDFMQKVVPGGDTPNRNQYNQLDCSGFIRMLWGYRSGLPVSQDPDGGTSIPRSSYEIAASAPGYLVAPYTGSQITNFSKLQIGDILFWDAEANTAEQIANNQQIDHLGMYVGIDSAGKRRFVSSRNSLQGPTLADSYYAPDYTQLRTPSVIDPMTTGTNLYSRQLRAIRRF